MKPQIIRWSPNTCKCEIIEYKDENGKISLLSHEEAVKAHERLFKDYPQNTTNPSSSPQIPPVVCKHHAGLTYKEAYDKIIADPDSEQHRISSVVRDAESDPKNLYSLSAQEKMMIKILMRILRGNNTEKIVEIPDTVFHPDKGLTFGFDAERKLLVKAEGFSQQEKVEIKSAQAVRFGDGKVEVV